MSLWLICVLKKDTNLRRRYSPTILLYGLGLTLLLSLGFNGFLLYEQSRLQGVCEYQTASPMATPGSKGYRTASRPSGRKAAWSKQPTRHRPGKVCTAIPPNSIPLKICQKYFTS